jgi:hypothetical protein
MPPWVLLQDPGSFWCRTSSPKRKFRGASFFISDYRIHKSVRKEEISSCNKTTEIFQGSWSDEWENESKSLTWLIWEKRKEFLFSVILLSSPLDSLPVNQFQDHHQLVLRRFVVHASALRAVPRALHDVCADLLCDDWGGDFSVRYDLDVNSM